MASSVASAAGGMPLSTSTSSTSTSSSASSLSPPSAPILAVALAAVSSFRARLARAFSSVVAFPAGGGDRTASKQPTTDLEKEKKKHADDLVKRHVRSMRTLAAVAPLASISSTGGEHVLLLLTRSIASFIKLYLLFLFMRVLLSWFPAFNWDRQPWLTLRQLTDPYLNVFRGIIPPFFGMIDFTPLLGFFVLQWVQGALEAVSVPDGSDLEGGSGFSSDEF